MLHVPSGLCAGCSAGRIGFCANLSESEIDRIAGVSRMHHFKKSQIIPRDEDAPMSALILRSGMIKISHALTDGRQQIVDFLTAGDILINHIMDRAVSATVEAATDVDACEIVLADLDALCGETPELAQSLLGAVFGEINRKNNQVMMLGRKRAEERVASLLLDFSDRAVRQGKPAECVNLPMSRAEIADYLSLTTETVSRAFSLFKKHQIVRLPKPHEVVIYNIAGLLEIASGASNLSVR